MSLYNQALELATTKHAGQVDKQNRPYMEHVIRVMNAALLMPSKLNIDSTVIMIASLLHDIVEDTDVTLEQIAGQYGTEMADIIDHLTRREDETYLTYVMRAASHPVARIIKLADNQVNNIDSSTSLKKRYDAAHHVLTGEVALFTYEES
jgi:(p)ppGpp synthase/HD superfamily hydrolase